jgi:hypothetical protein
VSSFKSQHCNNFEIKEACLHLGFFFPPRERIPAQRPGRGAYIPRRGFLPAKWGGQRGLWLGALLRQRGGHGGGFLPDAAFWGAVAQAIPSFADRPGAPGFLPDLVDVVGAALTSLQWGCVAVSSEV